MVSKKRPKPAKKCCKHCQDFINCEEKGTCCEYCDNWVKGHCNYTRSNKKITPEAIINVKTSFMFDDFRGADYGIDDYKNYEGYD